MSSSMYTEKEIKQMVKDAVKAALKDQKEAHDEAIQKLVDDHKLSTLSSPLSGTNLTKTSGLSYNSMGVISSTPLATMSRPSLSTSAGTSTASSGGGTQVSTSQDYFQTMSLGQSQVEKDLNQRPDDPVTEKGLYARLQAFDDYNELGGRRGLREVMGVKWLRVLEFTRGVSIPDDSRGDSGSTFRFYKYSKLPLRTRLRKDLHAPQGSHGRSHATQAMQLYAAQFAAELNDQLPKIEDPSDRVVQEMLIGYFYKVLQPDYLREKISHLKPRLSNRFSKCFESIQLRLW